MAFLLVSIYILFEYIIRDFSDKGSANYWMAHKIKDLCVPVFILFAIYTKTDKYTDTLTLIWGTVAGIYLFRTMCGFIMDDGIDNGLAIAAASLISLAVSSIIALIVAVRKISK